MHSQDQTMLQLSSEIKEVYGIDGQFRRLNGELDENYLVETENEKFIFKLMRADCDQSLVEMQINALKHLEDGDVAGSFPTLIATKSNEQTFRVERNGKSQLSWMISHLDGVHPGHDQPIDAYMAREIGREFAKLDLALESFQHQALKRDLKWDLLIVNLRVLLAYMRDAQ